MPTRKKRRRCSRCGSKRVVSKVVRISFAQSHSKNGHRTLCLWCARDLHLFLSEWLSRSDIVAALDRTPDFKPIVKDRFERAALGRTPEVSAMAGTPEKRGITVA